MSNSLDDRNKFIVDSLLSGLRSRKLMEMFNISRERVFQIFYRETGMVRGSLKEIKKDLDQNKLKFVCSGCGIPVKVKDGLHLHKYCSKCHEISSGKHRIMELTYTCQACSKTYHPLALSVRTSKNKYCSHKCYLRNKKLLFMQEAVKGK